MPRPPPIPLFILKGDANPVHSLSFWEKTGNEHLFAGCQSGQVQLWSLKSNRSIEGLQAHPGPCLNVACYDDYLITQGKGDGHVKLWHTLEGGGWAPTYTIFTRHSTYCYFSILKTGEGNAMIACPDDTNSVAVYSLNSGEKLKHMNFENFNSKNFGYITAIKAFNDPYSQRPMLLVAHEGGQLSLRDLSNEGKEICCLNVGEAILCLDFDPNEGVGIYGSPEGTQIKKFTFDTQTGTCELGSLTAITNPGISTTQIRPDFKIVATGGWDGRLRVFSWQQTKKEKHNVSFVDEKNDFSHNQSLSKITEPLKEEKMFTSESSIQLSETNSNMPTLQTQDVSNSEGSVHSELSTPSKDTISLYSTAMPAYKKPMKPLAVLKHHTKTIQRVAFSVGPVESWECPCLLAVGSSDGEISLWDLYN